MGLADEGKGVEKRRRSSRLEEQKKEARRKYEANQWREMLHRPNVEYWRQLYESDGFDIDHLVPPSLEGMRVYKCKQTHYPLIVRLYAKLGLHRYNMLQGKNLQLHFIKKYNKKFQTMPNTSYYITLAAMDPCTKRYSTFQTSIHEESWNSMELCCDIARPKIKGTKHRLLDDCKLHVKSLSVPKWFSDLDLADETRFHKVQKSEWDEHDWIRLYLELAFSTTNRFILNPKLSDLTIKEVVVETAKKVKPPTEILNCAMDATIYIKFDQEVGEGEVCTHKAIINRSLDATTGLLYLMGSNVKEGEEEEESSSDDD